MSRRCGDFGMDRAAASAPLVDTHKLKSSCLVFVSYIIKDSLGSFQFCLYCIMVEKAVVKHTEIIIGNSVYPFTRYSGYISRFLKCEIFLGIWLMNCVLLLFIHGTCSFIMFASLNNKSCSSCV